MAKQISPAGAKGANGDGEGAKGANSNVVGANRGAKKKEKTGVNKSALQAPTVMEKAAKALKLPTETPKAATAPPKIERRK